MSSVRGDLHFSKSRVTPMQIGTTSPECGRLFPQSLGYSTNSLTQKRTLGSIALRTRRELATLGYRASGGQFDELPVAPQGRQLSDGTITRAPPFTSPSPPALLVRNSPIVSPVQCLNSRWAWLSSAYSHACTAVVRETGCRLVQSRSARTRDIHCFGEVPISARKMSRSLRGPIPHHSAACCTVATGTRRACSQKADTRHALFAAARAIAHLENRTHRSPNEHAPSSSRKSWSAHSPMISRSARSLCSRSLAHSPNSALHPLRLSCTRNHSV